MPLNLTPEKYEHFRRVLCLMHGFANVLSKEHPEDWKQRLSDEMAAELETAKATIDDYFASFQIVYDSLV